MIISTEDISCCVCKSDQARLEATGVDFEYETSNQLWPFTKCIHCEHEYLKTRPRIQEAEKIYPAYYYTMSVPKKSSSARLITWLRSKIEGGRYRKLKTTLPKRPSILDIGIGDGHVLKSMKGLYGDQCLLYGLDIQIRASTRIDLEQIGVQCVESKIEDWNAKESSFDLIIMNQVIEHLWHPDEVLEKIYKLLRPNGVLFIETPNPSCLNRKWQKEFWGGYHFPRHLNLFTKNSLNKLSNPHFRLIEYKQFANPAFWIMGFRNRRKLNSYKSGTSLAENVNIRNPLALIFFMMIESILVMIGQASNHRFIFERK